VKDWTAENRTKEADFIEDVQATTDDCPPTSFPEKTFDIIK
jgi:hypothetical protein